MVDSLREISVLVLVFGFLDGVKGAEALVLAGSMFLCAVLVARLRS